MLDRESTADALDTLDDLLLWKLPPWRWQRVAELLVDLTAAARSGEPEAVRDATDALDQVSSLRATRLGEQPSVPPPPFVLERHNETMDSLRSVPEPEEKDDERLHTE